MIIKSSAWRIAFDVVVTVVAALLSSIALYTFVNPANFAPSGVDGIAMMTEKLTGLNMGYVSLAINVPLLVVAWFFISKRYVIYTSLFTVVSSLAIILMEAVGMYQYASENHAWISVFASGIMLGARTALMIKIGASTGGVDVIASCIQRKRPYINIETLISIFCYFTIAISFFVYQNIESVIMAVVQMLIFNLAMNAVLKPTRSAVEVHIITNKPEQFREDILANLKHGATVLDCHGMFTGESKSMIITIININQMNELIKLSRKYDSTFVYFNDVSGVWGNFRWKKTDAVK